jgi:Domain of unknown function (DUF4266)
MNNTIRRSQVMYHVRAALILSPLLVMGCAPVKPWQRELLADPIMQSDRNPLQTAQLDHVGGGGCGCN